MLDMRDYAQRVVDLTAGHTKEDITEERDWPLRLSLERALEIIGEAANRVPRDVQAQFPQIPWAAIIGMRNILIHAYDTIDLLQLWYAATVSVPELLRHLDTAIDRQPSFDR
ncbi:MAG: HepT-like ribonuclease domain-containing protein [Gammaproteobacteria bacterium]